MGAESDPGRAATAASEAASAPAKTLSSVLIDGDTAFAVWGETPARRLARAFARTGLESFIGETEIDEATGDLIVLRSDIVLDAPVVSALAEARDVVLLSTGPGKPEPVAAHVPAHRAREVLAVLRSGRLDDLPAGIGHATSETLGSAYWHALRKRETPYVLVLSPQTVAAAEWRMFMGTYKGATDFVTKWIWPRPAFAATKLCARAGVSPNFVTAVSLVFVAAAFYWFLSGDWLLGLAAGWIMTFLDTVDGKLARVTLASSKFGNFFDHSIDLIHPPFWYVAWGLGLAGGPLAYSRGELTALLTIIVAGYVLQRLIEGASIALFKLEIHVWRRIDTLFRQVTARRNPNLVLLSVFAIAGRPDLGLLAVALWTAVSLVLHGFQLLQAYLAWRRDGALTSWMAKPGAS
ncbi:MAG: CDP-alcohol phosphatidyltransferase family protein [Alphaproteobacteria bacterium]|nr:CDP-alcohol phosphatidyltransferase family protein [Alphaproteobacteria bacterium]